MQATEFFDFLTNNDTTPEAYMGNISMFNFRNYNGIDRSYAKFLEDNKKSFGVPDNITFIKSNPKIYTAFGDDITKTVTRDLIRVLRNTRVLIYNGQNDVVVNTPGVMLYLNSLSWSGIKEWKKTPKQMWTIVDEIQGWSKVSGNLWFVLVNGAGHMVPTDKPVAALHMMSRFVYNNNDWKN
jgi:carboxypeptidase C (cathepsin A)